MIKIENSIKSIIDDLKKEFGENFVTTLENKSKGRKSLSTGSYLLDKITETEGYIYGTIVEIFGAPATGKTTLAFMAIKECQKSGGIAAIIDLENKSSNNVNHWKKIGIKTEEVINFIPNGAEDVFDFIDKNIGKINLIIVDSLAALATKASIKNFENQRIASRASIISERLNIVNQKMINDKKTIILLINQIRDNFGSSFSWGQTTTTPGGWAPIFLSSLRIELSHKEWINEEKNGKKTTIGRKTRARIKKNSFGLPNKETELEIMLSKGIEKDREIINIAIESGLIKKSGSWFNYGENKICQGKENLMTYLNLEENNAIYKKIKSEILNNLNNY